ncbi:MAG: radical SAM protein [Syntrophales bacterium]|nr:radical SAM protein [Syntrophales bacterium]
MPLIIPIFVVHQGCPHRCIYCNEEKAVGEGAYPSAITETSFRETVYYYLGNSRRKKGPVQIAFYGGNFTGIDREYQRELLEMAGVFIRQGKVDSIRISTRPDCIDEACLDFLEGFSVKTVEIGAQSMVDDVLRLSLRGHSSSDIRHAVGLLKKRGFETGVHLMVGLPGDNPDGFALSVEETVALRPHTVRIHPTLVFSGTGLAEAFHRGDYKPLTMPEAIAACKYAVGKFTSAGIPVIRLGLQTTPEMEKAGSIVAGPFHPAFRSLVEEDIFFDMASLILSKLEIEGREVTFFLSPGDISSFRGQQNRNVKAIKNKFCLKAISLSIDPEQQKGCLIVGAEGKKWRLRGEEIFE